MIYRFPVAFVGWAATIEQVFDLIELQENSRKAAGLDPALASDEERMGLERKVSTVQFVTESLNRHLQRMLDWEDEAGLVGTEELDKPHLIEKAAALRKDHQQIREMLASLAEAAADLRPEEEPYFQAFCRNANAFLDQLDLHEKAEMLVLQQIYNDDEGGEG